MPADKPETTPAELTVAIEGELLIHVPPAGEPVRATVEPMQIVPPPPDIVALDETVIVFVTNEVPTVYVITTVPTETPVTTPVELTVATEGLLLLQVPPGVLSDSAMVEPTQTPEAPVIGDIEVLPPVTVKVIVRKQPLGSV